MSKELKNKQTLTEVNTIIKQKQADGSFVSLFPVTKMENVKDADGKNLNEALEDKAQKVHQHEYESDVPSTVQVGGIEKGFVTDGMSLEELVFKMLHQYVAPGISISGTPNGGTYEVGAVIPTVSITGTGRREADKIQRVRIFKNNTVVHTQDNETITGNVATTFTDTNVNANATYKADVFDGKNTVTSGNINFTFVRPMYIGSVPASAAVPSEDEIKAMTKKVVGRSNQSQNYTVDNRRFCIACPPGWEIKTILDPNSFDITGSFAKQTLAVTCLDGTVQNYNVYVSAPTSQTNFTVRYNV